MFFSEKIIESDVFPLLLECDGNKQLALAKSTLQQSAFYDYAKLYPYRTYIMGKKLTKAQCLFFVEIVDKLSQTYPYNDVVKALNETDFSRALEKDIDDKLKVANHSYDTVNDELSDNYSCLPINGFLYPIFPLSSKDIDVPLTLMAFSLWSISVAKASNYEKIKQYVERNHSEHVFIYKHENSQDLLADMINRIGRSLPESALYRATELLIATDSRYKELLLQVLTAERFIIND